MTITPALKQWLVENEYVVPQAQDLTFELTASRLLAGGSLSADKYKELSSMPSPSPEKVFDRGSGAEPSIRVKRPSERYLERRSAAYNKFGNPVINPETGQECSLMSEGAKARAGVLFKHLARKSGILRAPATEHEKMLLDEMVQQDTWAGHIDGDYYESIKSPGTVKTLLDDSTSGGLEITPIEFDHDVITFPLLTGELYPSVDIRPVARGRRIEGASISTPTLSWGGGDDTSITPFSTASMAAAIDTTVFGVDGAIEIGEDFLSDSPVNVGGVLTALVGERLAEELDDVIAGGNGTTQPEGLFTASGVGTVNTDNDVTGPPTLNDYITLLFAIGKQYRSARYRVAFVSNDTTFQRSRAIKVDTAATSTDQRPALAPLTVINTYETLGWPHKIQNDLANTKAAIVALAKYRMYRRLGLDVRFERGGKTLALANKTLMVYRARFGGRLMDANAMAKWTDGQS